MNCQYCKVEIPNTRTICDECVARNQPNLMPKVYTERGKRAAPAILEAKGLRPKASNQWVDCNGLYFTTMELNELCGFEAFETNPITSMRKHLETDFKDTIFYASILNSLKKQFGREIAPGESMPSGWVSAEGLKSELPGDGTQYSKILSGWILKEKDFHELRACLYRKKNGIPEPQSGCLVLLIATTLFLAFSNFA